MIECDTMAAETDKAVTAKMRPLGGRAVWNVGGGGKETVFPTMDKEAMNEAVATPED